MDAKHDVLVIGAGFAGMRAAIEAHDAGADVAIVSKLHPTRSHIRNRTSPPAVHPAPERTSCGTR